MEWWQGKLGMTGEVILLLSMAAAVQLDPTPSAKNTTQYVFGSMNTTLLALQRYPDSTCDRVSTPGLECPRGWSLQQDAKGVLCLWLSKDRETLSTAKSICRANGSYLLTGTLVNARSKVLIDFLGGYSSKIWYDSRKTHYRCGSFSDGTFQPSSYCDNYRQFVCVHTPVCSSNRIGEQCDHECHCIKGQCHGQPCPDGCQPGWRGVYCCMKETPANIAYYCVNTGSERYMMLRVDPKSIHYEALEPVDSAGRELEWCQEISVSRDPRDYSYTIVVPVHAGDRACGGHKTGNSTYTWRLALREMTGVQLPFDRTIVITCDFEHAETYSRDLQNSILSDSPKAPTLSLKPKTEDVVLELVDPVTSYVIHEAEVGRAVMLRMRLSVSGDVTARGVSPYNCEARSGEGNHVRQLTDFNGCPEMPSVMSSLRGSNGTVTSKTFPLFAFHGQKSLVIDCHFTFCFTETQQPTCDNRCAAMPKSHRRKRASQKQGGAVTTQVRILPDPGSRPAGSTRPEAPRMMTPVTWFLAALLLVVSGTLVYTLYLYAGPQRTVHVDQISI